MENELLAYYVSPFCTEFSTEVLKTEVCTLRKGKIMIRQSQKPLKTKRIPRRTNMSVGLATICTDGLVIATDRKISRGEFNSYEAKLVEIPFGKSSEKRLVMGYSGVPNDVLHVIVDHLKISIEGKQKTFTQIREDIQSVLKISLAERGEEVHQLLYAFTDQDKFHLLKSYNSDVVPVPVWDCIGCGDSALTRYLGGIFLEQRIHLPVLRAVPICIYMVAQAKKYVDGCGGDTDLQVIRRDGRTKHFHVGPELEAATDKVEQSLNGLLTIATVPGITSGQTEYLIEQLRDVLDKEGAIFDKFLGNI